MEMAVNPFGGASRIVPDFVDMDIEKVRRIVAISYDLGFGLRGTPAAKQFPAMLLRCEVRFAQVAGS